MAKRDRLDTISERMEKMEDRFIRRYERQAWKALRDAIRPVLIRIRAIDNPRDVKSEIDSLVTDIPIRELMIKIHETVGLAFIKWQLQAFKGSGLDLQTKNDQIANDFDDYEAVWLSIVQQYVDSHGVEMIATIHATNRKAAIEIISQVIDEAMVSGAGIPEIKETILRRIPQEWRRQRFRAAAIARTEVLSASSHGAMQAARDLKIELEKVWVARPTGDFRPEHVANNRVAIDLDDKWPGVDGVLMDRPHDPAGGAKNNINCRCRAVFQRKGGGNNSQPPQTALAI